MAVVTAYENRCVWGDRIDQLFGGQLGWIPLGFIPIATHDPLAFRGLLDLLTDAAGKLLGAGGVIELYRVELQATTNEMNVRIVEAGQQQFTSGVNHAGVGAVPRFNIGVGADTDDAVAQNSDGLSRGIDLVHSPDLGVGDDEICGWLRLGGDGDRGKQEKNLREKSTKSLHMLSVPGDAISAPISAWRAARQRMFF